MGLAPQKTRPWLVTLLCLVLMAGFAGLGFEIFSRYRSARQAKVAAKAQVAVAREERVKVAVHVAPAPIPRSLPLVGDAGVDADGYPRQYVDAPGVRSLLHAHRFTELSAYFEELQAAFEADPRKELWPLDFVEAFATAEPEIVADLDAWALATPKSAAPFAARGSHYVAAMWALRGGKYIGETPAEDIRAMSEASEHARDDLAHALTLRPRVLVAMREQMAVGMVAGRRSDIADAYARGVHACPSCFTIQQSYLRTLPPRWGGSYAQIQNVLSKLDVTKNPRLGVLLGYEDLVRARDHETAQKYDEAVADMDRAVKHGVYWEYLLERAELLERLDRFDEALADLDSAVASRPGNAAVRAFRSTIRYDRKDYVGAGHDLLFALQKDPTESRVKDNLGSVVHGINFAAQELDKSGKHADALDASELAMALAPLDRETQSLHGRLVLGDATTPARIAELEAKTAADPGSFRDVQQLDYALSRQGKFERIAAMWDAYVKLHPDDGRGYMERSGTNYHLGKKVEERADLVKACELGVNEGCERAAVP
ncbi:MAG: hypothetical protein JWM74_1631 [Myxococcaceae bacterium]|nr:hypothetical protein [Myxococcaceae bacterium]